jgi:hypothetical protein
MGVGINYKGVGGNRHFDLNGVPTGEADALFKTPRRHKQLLPENFKKALHPQPVDPIAKENEGKVKLNAFDMRPDTLDKKTMPGSAVRTSMSGLCLEGEQENPSVVGTKLYGSHGGKKGYHAFDEFDPPVEGGRVGVLGAGGKGADNSVAKAGAPFAYQVTSRVVMEIDDLGRQILVEYDKDVQNTALGRSHTVTGERRRIIGVIAARNEGVDILHPFKVIYDATEGYQGWIVYLPQGCLVKYGNSDIGLDVKNVFVDGMEKSENPKYNANDWYKITVGKIGRVGLKVSTGSTWSFSVVGQPNGDTEADIDFEIAEITSNDAENGFLCKQFVLTPIRLCDAKNTEDSDTIPNADEKSLSSIAEKYTATGGKTLWWSIKGFGKFNPPNREEELGTFQASTSLELSEDEESECAFLVRQGNISAPNANSIGYRTVKIKKGGADMPFQIKVVDGVKTITNNTFYFDGAEHTLPDFTAIPDTGCVYLLVYKKPPTEAIALQWVFGLSNNINSLSGYGTYAIKLYEFKASKMVMDFRNTFLTLSSGSFYPCQKLDVISDLEFLPPGTGENRTDKYVLKATRKMIQGNFEILPKTTETKMISMFDMVDVEYVSNTHYGTTPDGKNNYVFYNDFKRILVPGIEETPKPPHNRGWGVVFSTVPHSIGDEDVLPSS